MPRQSITRIDNHLWCIVTCKIIEVPMKANEAETEYAFSREETWYPRNYPLQQSITALQNKKACSFIQFGENLMIFEVELMAGTSLLSCRTNCVRWSNAVVQSQKAFFPEESNFPKMLVS